MSKPHKHCEVIKAWADGAEIEFKYNEAYDWLIIYNPSFHPDHLYRVKPKTFEVIVTRDLGYMDYVFKERKPHTPSRADEQVVKLTYENGKLTGAEVLK